MARRNGNNVVGDLNELKATSLLLEHGMSINALTASDTGWDLHCHVPDDLLRQASKAGKTSWSLSGRTIHVQVKTSASGPLGIGTVRGWLSGTTSGVPTFLFIYRGKKPVFATPRDLYHWLPSGIDEGDTHKYTLAGKQTPKQTPLDTFQYREDRFPSVVKFWIEHPRLAFAYEELTDWINGDIERPEHTFDDLIQDLVIPIWAAKGVNRDTSPDQLLKSAADLYEAAGFADYEKRGESFIKGGDLYELTHGDTAVSWTSSTNLISSLLRPDDPAATALELLRALNRLSGTDASSPS